MAVNACHLVIFVLVALFINDCKMQFAWNHIPIGANFDKSEKLVASAFRFAVQKLNQEIHNFKVNTSTRMVEQEDSYSLTTTLCSQMAAGIFFFFGTHHPDTFNTLRAYMNKLSMPFITPSQPVPTVSSLLRGYTIYMRPDYSKAMLAVMRFYQWRKIYYVYDSNEGLTRLQQLFDVMASEEVIFQVDMRRVDGPEHANVLFASLEKARRREAKKVVIDLSTDNVEKMLMQQIQEKVTWKLNFHYLLAGLGILELDKLDKVFAFGGMNITGLVIMDYKNETIKTTVNEWTAAQKIWSVHDGRSSISEPWKSHYNEEPIIPQMTFEAAMTFDAVELIFRALQKIWRQQRYVIDRTLVSGAFINNNTEGLDCTTKPVLPWSYGSTIMKVLKETNFVGLTGNISFDDDGLRKSLSMDVLDVNTNRGLAKIGTWHPRKRFWIEKSPSLMKEKGNNTFSNKTRIITSILTEPYLMNRTHDDDGQPVYGNDIYYGYCADLAKLVAEAVGFQYIIKPVADGKYGGQEADDSWNGMVGELMRNEADLAIAPLTTTSSRERVIDFSKPFMSLGISIMIRKPDPNDPGFFSFMNPLSYEIWMCVVFAYIGVSVVLFLVSRFSPFEWHVEDHIEGPTVTNNFTITNSLWFSLGAFMQQGCDIEPRSVSGRIVGSVWWFFTLIIISSYTANLAAFLTVERMQSPIESAEDLAKQTEIKYGTVSGGSTMEFFKVSKVPTYERMWAFMSTQDPSVFVETNEAGIQRVRTDRNYAFLLESTTNDFANERLPCNTMKVGHTLDSKGYGIATPRGSDIREHINLGVLELRENGKLHEIEKDWWITKGKCKNEGTVKKGETTSALQLKNVAGIFFILVAGLILSLIVAAFEFLYKSRAEARRRNTSFSNTARSKARLSIRGSSDKQSTAVFLYSN